MTITEANAANEIAQEVLTLAATGAKIGPALSGSLAFLLLKANRVLSAGLDDRRFLDGLARVRKATTRKAVA